MKKMDIVSFETANRLKEAGFPQPEPAVGQMWHDNEPYFIGYIDGHRFSGIYTRSGYVIKKYDLFGIANDIFMPTATDILRIADIQMWWNEAEMCFWAKAWPNVKVEVFTDQNAAEAAAAAWLEMHEKK